MRSVKRDYMRHVPGYDGYLVTRDGVVYSQLRLGALKKRQCRLQRFDPDAKPRKMCSTIRWQCGHEYVWLRVNGKRAKVYVHTLVLLAFYGPRPHKHECRHLNGNPADNRAENLAWGTRKENVADSIKHGSFFGGRPMSCVDKEEVARLRWSGCTYAEIASRLKCSPSTVGRSIATRLN